MPVVTTVERQVYENVRTRELTFVYDPETCVLVGTTTGTLQDFTQWLDSEYRSTMEKLAIEGVTK